MAAAVGDVLGPIQVLVVNATGPQPEAQLSEVDWQDHLAQLSFFVRIPVLLGRAVLPAMQADRFGRIIRARLELLGAVDLRLDGAGERLDAAGGSVDAGWAESVTITPP